MFAQHILWQPSQGRARNKLEIETNQTMQLVPHLHAGNEVPLLFVPNRFIFQPWRLFWAQLDHSICSIPSQLATNLRSVVSEKAHRRSTRLCHASSVVSVGVPIYSVLSPKRPWLNRVWWYCTRWLSGAALRFEDIILIVSFTPRANEDGVWLTVCSQAVDAGNMKDLPIRHQRENHKIQRREKNPRHRPAIATFFTTQDSPFSQVDIIDRDGLIVRLLVSGLRPNPWYWRHDCDVAVSWSSTVEILLSGFWWNFANIFGKVIGHIWLPGCEKMMGVEKPGYLGIENYWLTRKTRSTLLTAWMKSKCTRLRSVRMERESNETRWTLLHATKYNPTQPTKKPKIFGESKTIRCTEAHRRSATV